MSHAQRAESNDGRSRFSQFGELESEAALEQDDRNEESHDGEKSLGPRFAYEIVVNAGSGGEGETKSKREEDEDGGQLESPRQPLCGDSKCQDKSQIGEGCHGEECARENPLREFRKRLRFVFTCDRGATRPNVDPFRSGPATRVLEESASVGGSIGLGLKSICGGVIRGKVGRVSPQVSLIGRTVRRRRARILQCMSSEGEEEGLH